MRVTTTLFWKCGRGMRPFFRLNYARGLTVMRKKIRSVA
tara:strand:+ start:13642 stop:13758 length:117 start_codon:yes stop_codon:yes gene_type:complete